MHFCYTIKPIILIEPLTKLRILNISQDLLFGKAKIYSILMDLLLNLALEVINLLYQYTKVLSGIKKRYAFQQKKNN